MIFEQIVFWGLAIGSIGSALMVVHVRDVFRGALFLVGTFLTVAGMFVLLNAEFLAAVEVLIYAGAIAILIIFATMMTKDVRHGNQPTRMQPLALTIGVLLLAALVFTISVTDWPQWREAGLTPQTIHAVEEVLVNTPQWLGGLLLREFVLPFEVASVLLLAAVIGALALVRER